MAEKTSVTGGGLLSYYTLSVLGSIYKIMMKGTPSVTKLLNSFSPMLHNVIIAQHLRHASGSSGAIIYRQDKS